MALTNYSKNKMGDGWYRGQALGAPAARHYALFSVKPALDGTGGTELSNGTSPGYARVNVGTLSAAYDAWASGVSQNAVQILWGPNSGVANWVEAVAFGSYDAASAGILLEVDWFIKPNSRTPFTAVAATDILTAVAHAFINGAKVVIQGTGLPSGLSADTIYYVIGVSGNTFQLSTTSGGAAINFTADGDGTIFEVVTQVVVQNGDAKFNTGDLDILL